MIVLCTGDRDWKNLDLIRAVLSGLKSKDDICIIHGAARGADVRCGIAGEELNYSVIEYPANWALHGKAAGHIRNREMLSKKPDLVIAFHNNINESKGTKDMVKISLKAGIRVILVTETEVKEIKTLED
jgi:hypothetical protein